MFDRKPVTTSEPKTYTIKLRTGDEVTVTGSLLAAKDVPVLCILDDENVVLFMAPYDQIVSVIASEDPAVESVRGAGVKAG